MDATGIPLYSQRDYPNENRPKAGTDQDMGLQSKSPFQVYASTFNGGAANEYSLNLPHTSHPKLPLPLSIICQLTKVIYLKFPAVSVILISMNPRTTLI